MCITIEASNLDKATHFALEGHSGISARWFCEQELSNSSQRNHSNCRESSSLEKRKEIKTQILRKCSVYSQMTAKQMI